jgi:hypothetical protein
MTIATATEIQSTPDRQYVMLYRLARLTPRSREEDNRFAHELKMVMVKVRTK